MGGGMGRWAGGGWVGLTLQQLLLWGGSGAPRAQAATWQDVKHRHSVVHLQVVVGHVQLAGGPAGGAGWTGTAER